MKNVVETDGAQVFFIWFSLLIISVVYLQAVRNWMVLTLDIMWSQEKIFTDGFVVLSQVVKNWVVFDTFILDYLVMYCNIAYIQSTHYILSNLMNIAEYHTY